MSESVRSETCPHAAGSPAQPTSLRLPTGRSAAKIALAYAAVGVVWIVGSGWLLHHFVHDQSLESDIEMVKGWVYVAVTALLLGFALERYFRAIRESAQRLQESEKRYRALFDQAVEGVMLMKTDGTDLRVNAAFARMHGYDSPKEMESLRLQDLLAPATVQLASELLRSGSVGKTVTLEVEHYRKDRSTFPLSVTASCIRLGGMSFWLSFHRDITAQRQAEETLHQRLELQDQLSKVVATVPGLIYSFRLAPDGTASMPFSTPLVEELFGFRSEELRLDFAPAFARVHPDDQSRVWASIAESARTLAPWRDSFRVCHPRKSEIWLEAHSVPRREPDGSVLWHGFVQDISERKRAEEALRQSQERLNFAMQASRTGAWSLNLQDNTATRTLIHAQIFGYQTADEEWTMDTFMSHVLPEDRERVRQCVQTGIDARSGWSFECRIRRVDDQVRWVFVTGGFEQSGLVPRISGIIQDITERKNQAAEIARARDFYLSLLENAPALVWRSGTDAKCNWFNATWLNFTGRKMEQEMGDGWVEGVHPDDLARCVKHYLDSFQQRRPFAMEYRLRHHDGGYRWIVDHGVPFHGLTGSFGGYIGYCYDITERKQAAHDLQESEARFRALVETTFDWMWEVDAEGRYTYVSPKIKDLLGYTPEEVLGQTPFDLMPEAEAQRVGALFSELVAKRKPFSALENTNRHKDGRLVVLETSGVPVSDAHGRFQGYRGMDRDVTERKRAEAVLRESLLFRREAEKIGRIGAWKVNPTTDFLYWTEGVYEILEAPLDYKPGLGEGIKFFDAESIPVLQEALHTAFHEGTPFVMEAGVTTTAGRHLWTEVRGLGRVEEGEDAYVMGTCQDITERKRLEDQFRQSQKLEAIGQMAGGVAHDFNNLLTAILMQSDIEEGGADLPPEIAEAFHDIKRAAERGASLTRQLLTFSRRQVMRPQKVDLNDLVNNLAKMLRRIVGEDIRLKLDLHTAPLWLHADPGMLEQVIMNFTVNARDAMPKGGSLTLTTDGVSLDAEQARQYVDAAPGHYARLTVTDTGCGIPPEIQPRIFEPFFTTKEVGKGTGLGLATVFGIVKQHKGWLSVQSAPGQGTTIRVHLPISKAPQPETGVPAKPKPSGGSETILLVEDDPAVRVATQTILQRQGYKVLVSNHGRGALSASRQHPDKIDLLLTDIVMPEGMYGRELAANLLKERPGLKTIYMSGYSAELAGGELTLQPGQQFLQKPFTPDQLLALVRLCLES